MSEKENLALKLNDDMNNTYSIYIIQKKRGSNCRGFEIVEG